jgi:hypothetical protein
MPVTHTNRKGVTYTLYRGQTASGAPRYFFGRQTHGDPVEHLPAGFAIRESPNGVVSLVKKRPVLLQPAEIAAVEAVVRRHPQAPVYQVVAKPDRIEVYAQEGFDVATVERVLVAAGVSPVGLAATLQEEAERTARYVPQLRFRLLDPARRTFGAERMCYAGGIDDWLTLGDTGSVEELAAALVPTLGTDAFYDLW